ncbi:transcriptional regulator, IclR family [Halogranum amylolyticum]|uniref:Transcriptional regulator, IclR family n=1 Tax=Halogranum amylolyticum TaxID=660520 RepID=A0A1H8MTQ4_9EURY|nr:IclR family transcriptional regulator [Halogranum amylolyticum]SEO20861.1 transcriptional regulator, IclR family [Halogranum amylolyticum]
MARAKNPVKAVKTTSSIVEKLAELDEAGVTELSNHLEITKGTIHNHLTTLEEVGLVVKEDGKFRLGLRFFELGEQTKSRYKIYDVAVPEVDKLAEETGELGNVLVEEHGRGFYLYRKEGENALSLDTGIGSRVYLHQTGLGKAILAHLPEERVHEIVDEHGLAPSTDQTLSTREELFENLAEIRERGYALDMEERAEGIRCVSAPVITNDDVVRGAVSVAGPVSRMRGEYLESTVPDLVMRAANVVSINLSYR